ncbi:ROK family protein [Propionispira raffinosivorans]|uniref:ROK family protein n=1 Tax=Propionispira raffinosivorans TaxID=86959 RepID=UPI00037670F8|nr:ROK family protein [Propionispira raffinosivorans]
MSVNITLMREMNLNVLRSTIQSCKQASKPQLAELTGLSVVTINTLIKILLENGEVFEGSTIAATGGRPAAEYHFNENHRLALTIYMREVDGKDTAFISVDNLFGESIETEIKTLQNIQIDDFDKIVEFYLQKYPKISLLACGIPGREINGKLSIFDYRGLRGIAFTDHFKEQFHLPVIFENDVCAAVIGYCSTKKNFTDECVVGIYFPTNYPPGAGIFINGKIYKGRDGFAGEIKYLPIGIKWNEIGPTEFSLQEASQRMILAITSLYNPSKVILYGEAFSQGMEQEISRLCEQSINQAFLPELIINKNFNEDFARGIRQLALENLTENVKPIKK